MKRSRRSRRLGLLLTIVAALQITSAVNSVSHAATAVTSVRSGDWTDPSVWSGGRMPDSGDTVTVARGTTVAYTGSEGTVLGPTTVEGTLVFPPERTGVLQLNRNLIVTGRLAMRPANAKVRHQIRFVGVDESKFHGGGMEPLATDVGLWVMGDGVLDVQGTPKTAWLRAAGTIAKGATSVTLTDAPVGWRPGDRLVITPTADRSSYDETTVKQVSGSTVVLSKPVANTAHPMVNGRWTAEVLNMTRNVEIGGTAQGRSHVFLHSTRPQVVSYAELTHTGPRQKVARRDGDKVDAFVPGRYALHFHQMGEYSKGSIVEGTVVHDAGSHAFVAHHSDGVTYRSTITDQTIEDPYWNDMFNNTSSSSGGTVSQADSQTNGTLIDGAVASRAALGTRGSGFMLGAGNGNRIRNSVAVGLVGYGADGSGFGWEEDNKGNWEFDDNVAHNNVGHGIFNWQNEQEEHFPIRRFVAYFNSGDGIKHGAYVNRFRYEDNYLYGNHQAGLELLALSSPLEDRHTGMPLPNEHPQSFVRMTIDQAGLPTPAVSTGDHRLNATGFPGVIRDSVLTGSTGAQVQAATPEFNNPDVYDFVNNVYGGKAFNLERGYVMPGNLWRVQDRVFGAFAVRPSDEAGRLVPEWNARITPIAPFDKGDFVSPFTPWLSPGPTPTPGPGEVAPSASIRRPADTPASSGTTPSGAPSTPVQLAPAPAAPAPPPPTDPTPAPSGICDLSGAASAPPAVSWDFETSAQGWRNENDVLDVRASGGSLVGRIGGPDSQIMGPLTSIDAAKAKRVVVRLRNQTPGTSAEIYFRVDTDSTWAWTGTKRVVVPIEPFSDYRTYTFDFCGVPEWRGKIAQLRLDPSTSSPGSFAVDWIRVT